MISFGIGRPFSNASAADGCMLHLRKTQQSPVAAAPIAL
jgi:hypothetical protein